MVVDFKDIKISKEFSEHKPYEAKMNNCRDFYKKNLCIDSPIVCNKNLLLIDGYIRYLVLKENNYCGDIDVIISEEIKEPHTYLWGKHRGNNKEYLWKISDELDIKPYMEVIAYTKHGLEPILVTRIEKLDTPPNSDRRIKTLKINRIVPFEEQNHGKLLKEMANRSAQLTKEIERYNKKWEE